MASETDLIQTIQKMPESLRQELFHYANNLINNSSESIAQPNALQEDISVKKRRSGILKGTFVLPLAEDFDESLDGFNEYME